MFIIFSNRWLVIIKSWNSKSLWLQLSQKTWYVDPWNPRRGSCCWSIVVQFGTRTKSVKELWLPQITTDSLENWKFIHSFLLKQTIHGQKMQILLTVILPKRVTNWRACPSEVINAPFRAFLADFATICGSWLGEAVGRVVGVVARWDPFETHLKPGEEIGKSC